MIQERIGYGACLAQLLEAACKYIVLFMRASEMLLWLRWSVLRLLQPQNPHRDDALWYFALGRWIILCFDLLGWYSPQGLKVAAGSLALLAVQIGVEKYFHGSLIHCILDHLNFAVSIADYPFTGAQLEWARKHFQRYR